MPQRSHIHPETLLAKAGCQPDSDLGGATPPVHMASTFERSEDGTYESGYVYGRLANPTRDRLEDTLARLEGAASARVFATGMAAANALLQTLHAGDHVILGDDLYFGVRNLVHGMAGRGLLTYSEVDTSCADTDSGAESAAVQAIRAALVPATKLVWIETPSNPLLRITDIAAVAACCQEHGAALVVDGTWTTPLLQRPLELGADVVLHSVTKYLSGHSDVLGGALVFRTDNELTHAVHAIQQSAGAILDPFSCWLTLRGLRSLPARMRVQTESAGILADWLSDDPRVSAVHYPGLAHHPGHAVAARQMTGFGAMLSIRTGRSGDETLARVGRARVFTRATSLGGTESLIEHRRSVEGEGSRTPADLIRLSIGLEHVDDLREDLDRILA
ncbi:MAG: aminotransferase class I/II-fold pyridoxal phosphate-dependent enzyme [Rhodothermales bacterium]